MLTTCVVVWLAVIAVSVAAIVALVELGTGRAGDPSSDSSTPWGLYLVIGISAVIILGSIPLLLRARRAARQEPPPARRPPVATPRRPAPIETNTEKLRVFGSAPAVPGRNRPSSRQSERLAYAGRMSAEMVEAMWLRFAVSIATAIGAATLAAATATYFMGVRDDGLAAAALVIAALITVAMPLIPVRHLRQLRAQI